MTWLHRLRRRRALLREAAAYDREADHIMRVMVRPIDRDKGALSMLEMKRRAARASAEYKREEAGRL